MKVLTDLGMASMAFYLLPNKMTAVCEVTFENGYVLQGFAPVAAPEGLHSSYTHAREKALEKVTIIQGYVEAEGKFNELRRDQSTHHILLRTLRKLFSR